MCFWPRFIVVMLGSHVQGDVDTELVALRAFIADLNGLSENFDFDTLLEEYKVVAKSASPPPTTLPGSGSARPSLRP